MTTKTRSRRTYTYRIPVDDKAAMMRLRRFQRGHDEYFIHELPDREVPNSNAVKNWGCVFYQSKEQHGDYLGEFTGGAIPGLEEYRHSLEWKPHPDTELLEMRHSNSGGTDIRGESFVGTHDPRLSDYVSIEMHVNWTPSEIRAIWNGESVPDKINYSHDPPEISASEARELWREQMHYAEQEGFEKAKEKLHEYMENCDHDHVLEEYNSRRETTTGVCEDCGKEWDAFSYQDAKENGELNVVGTA